MPTRAHYVLPSFSGVTRARVGINKYDFGVHIILPECDGMKGRVEGFPLVGGGPPGRRVRDHHGEIPPCPPEAGHKASRSPKT